MGLFIGGFVRIRQAIARQSPSRSREAAVGVERARRGGASKGGRRSPRHAQHGYAESRACAARGATDLLHRVVKAGFAAPGEAELPRERLWRLRKAAYDAAHFAARVISPFRHALNSVTFVKRVRRPRAPIAFCPRLLQFSSLSLPGLLAEA